MYLINLLAKSVKRANRRAMEKMADLYGILSESLSGIQAVKAFTMERAERRRFHHTAKEYMRKQLRIALYQDTQKFIYSSDGAHELYDLHWDSQ